MSTASVDWAAISHSVRLKGQKWRPVVLVGIQNRKGKRNKRKRREEQQKIHSSCNPVAIQIRMQNADAIAISPMLASRAMVNRLVMLQHGQSGRQYWSILRSGGRSSSGSDSGVPISPVTNPFSSSCLLKGLSIKSAIKAGRSRTKIESNTRTGHGIRQDIRNESESRNRIGCHLRLRLGRKNPLGHKTKLARCLFRSFVGHRQTRKALLHLPPPPAQSTTNT